jgi:guanylate kinase
LQRLKHRKTDDPTELMTRFSTATRELAAAPDFDYVVFNKQDRLQDAINDIAAIVRAELLRTQQPDIHV